MLVESTVKWTLGCKSWRVKRVIGGKEKLTVELVPRRGSRRDAAGAASTGQGTTRCRNVRGGIWRCGEYRFGSAAVLGG
jgi:hypothetical protein